MYEWRWFLRARRFAQGGARTLAAEVKIDFGQTGDAISGAHVVPHDPSTRCDGGVPCWRRNMAVATALTSGKFLFCARPSDRIETNSGTRRIRFTSWATRSAYQSRDRSATALDQVPGGTPNTHDVQLRLLRSMTQAEYRGGGWPLRAGGRELLHFTISIRRYTRIDDPPADRPAVSRKETLPRGGRAG